MAPGRKRGANKAKANRELSLGDLVLAKVKGFPPWPAKVQSSLYFILFSFFLFHLIRCCDYVYVVYCNLGNVFCFRRK